MFRHDFRKLLHSPLFYITILVMEACAVSSAWDPMRHCNDLLYLATEGWSEGNSMVMIVLPLISGMAFASGYCAEQQGGCHYSVMVRGSRLGYCVSKVGVAALSGFLMVLVAGVLFPAVCLVLRRGDLVLAGQEAEAWFEPYWEHVFLERGYPLIAWASWLLAYCVAAAVWPALALCVSLVVRNRYVVIVSPFVAEQLWGTLVVGIHQPRLSYSTLMPGMMGELPYSGWVVRLVVVGTVCLAELALFTWGTMRQTR